MLGKGKYIFCISMLLIGCSRSGHIYQGYIEGKYTYAASAVSGNLLQLLVTRGDQVKPGQVIFTLDPEPEQSKLKQSEQQLAQAWQVLADLEKGQRETVIQSLEAQRAQAEAAADFAQKTLQRYSQLEVKQAIAKEAVDRASSEYKQNTNKIKQLTANIAEAKLGARENAITAQKASVDALIAAVKQARWALDQKTVVAPVAAQVFDTLYEPGEFVAASQPVVSLLPPDKMKVVFFVPEKVVSKLHVNDGIAFTCDSCETSYTARLTFVSPTAEYTSPLIYSQASREKLIYRIEALIKPEIAVQFHPGQPLDVTINQ